MSSGFWKQSRRRPVPTARRGGFLLVELLIVVSIIVLVLAIATPALQLLNGDRSLESLQNQAAAALGVARSDAIYTQTPTGVFFFVDPLTGVQSMVEVQQTPIAGDPQWVDSVPGRDTQNGPKGVALQLIQNQTVNDKYMGAGVIMFDGTGQMVSQLYAISTISNLGKRLQLNANIGGGVGGLGTNPFYSQVGFIIFDHNAFASYGGTDADRDMAPLLGQVAVGSNGLSETDEEKWLEQNGLFVLINPATGELFKGK